MKKKAPIIHIGYPKTATTTLQEVIFQNHSELINIGKPNSFRKNKEYSKDYENLRKFIITASDKNFEKYKEKYKALINNIQKPIILSDENLSFASFLGIPKGWGVHVKISHEMIAYRLKELFSSSKIFITIRNQKSFLESFYLHLARLNRTNKSFENWINFLWENEEYYSVINFLKYDETYLAYRKFYKKDEIKIFIYEKCSVDFKQWLREISIFGEFSEEETLKIYKGEHLNATRKNSIIHKIKNFILHKPNLAQVKFPDALRNRIDNYFEESNYNLSRILNTNINEYGYYYNENRPLC